MSIRVADVEGEHWNQDSDVEISRLGGRWDRKGKRWCNDADNLLVQRVHRGQESAARWLFQWIERSITGDWKDFKTAYSVLLVGGRRSGKSHLACLVLVAYAVANPGAVIWAVSTTLEAGEELDRALMSMMPRAWYKRRVLGTGKPLTFKLANGSKILLRSGAKAHALKAGRVDFALLNEGQMQDQRAFVQLRGAIADRSGLVIVTANPPDQPSGRWIEDHFLGCKSGEIDAVAFELDPRENPWVNFAVLESMKNEVDEKTYQRDVLGLFAPIGDVVFYAWNDRENLRDPPADLVDVTAEFTKTHFGRSFGYLAGADFQLTPHMAMVIYKFFRDPTDSSEVLAWVVDEFIVENTDENGLIDAAEDSPRWQATGPIEGQTYRGWIEPGDDPRNPVHVGVVADASGWWQDGAHSKGPNSDRAFAARRWAFLYRPQKTSNANPGLVERCKAGNARMKSASDHRRLFVARACTQTAEAVRRWEIRNGQPYRRSMYAHICDAVTYPIYRLFGKPRVKAGKMEYRGVNTRTRSAEMKGF